MSDELGQLILGQAVTAPPPFPTPQLGNVYIPLAQKESSNNPQARNPASTAQGYYQITAPTYADIQKIDPYFVNKRQDQLTPEEQNRAVLTLRDKIQVPALQQLGLQPTESNIQLAHFLGPQGAADFLRNGYISPEAAAANGGLQKTINIARDRMALGAQADAQNKQLAQANQSEIMPQDALGGMILGITPPTAEQPAQPTQPAPTEATAPVEQPSAVSSIAQKRFATEETKDRTFTDYVKDTGKSVASFLDNTIGAVAPTAISVVSYPLAKLVEITASATGGKFNASDAVNSIVEPISQPFAKAFGIDPNDPAYKGEMTNRVMSFVGENVGKGSQELSDAFYDKTGVRIPPADFEYAANLGLMAVTAKAAPKVTEGVKGVTEKLQDQFQQKKGEALPVETRVEPGFVTEQAPGISVKYPVETQLTPDQLALKNAEVITGEPVITPEIRALADQLTTDQVVKIYEAKQAGATPESIQTMIDQFAGKKGAAEVPTTVETQLTKQLQEKQVPIKVVEENPPMPSAPPSASDVRSRQNVLQEVGIDVTRRSALEGNPKEASSQYITSKADQGPYATGMTNQINYEKKALDTHFSKIANESGGEVPRYGTPEQQGDLIKIGDKVKDALNEGYKKHIAEGKKLYEDAAKQHGDKPVSVDKFSEFLKQDENFAYEKEKGLQSAIKTYMQRKGLMDKDGNVQPMTVADAEGVRQFINDKYNFETSGLIKKMKDQIDNQVFEQVGGETYQNARKHWAKGKETYENPKAIGDLLSDRGVNQKIASEDVMNRVSGLKQSQFKHLVETLRNDGQTNALNQIKTSLVDEIRRAGQSATNEPFNSVKASKTAAALGEKLKVAFADDPKALDRIYKGLEAANIVHIPTSYPGAAVQTNLLRNKFSDIAIQRTMGAAGGSAGVFFGGPAGGAVGLAAGEFAGGKMVSARQTRRQQKQLQKELVGSSERIPLKNILKTK